MEGELLLNISNAYSNYLAAASAQMGIPLAFIAGFLVIIAIWSLAWKGVALWKSSHKNQLLWFIILLIVNTVGILEILYIFVFSKLSFKSKVQEKPSKKKKL